MLMGLLAAYVFAGPLVFAAMSLVLVGQAVQGSAVTLAATVFLSIPLFSGAGLSVLYRWCFARPAVGAASLLTGAAVLVFLLSEPSFIFCIASLLMGSATAATITGDVVQSMGAIATFVALVCAVIMFGVLLLELPFRFFSPQQRVLDDGFFRAVRWIGGLVLFVAGSSIVRQEGVARLGDAIRRLGGS
jgi:hypothetical protein